MPFRPLKLVHPISTFMSQRSVQGDFLFEDPAEGGRLGLATLAIAQPALHLRSDINIQFELVFK